MQIHTSRLTLREFYLADFADVWAYERLPLVQRYEPPRDEAAVRRYLEEALAWAAQTPRTHCQMALTIRPGAVAVGRISLGLNIAEISEWEIGWTVHPDLWGKGYASEGAQAMLAFAFNTLHAHRVVAFCHAENVASVRVMEKLGMQREAQLRQTRWLCGVWSDELLYTILEHEWAAQAASDTGSSSAASGDGSVSVSG